MLNQTSFDDAYGAITFVFGVISVIVLFIKSIWYIDKIKHNIKQTNNNFIIINFKRLKNKILKD